MEQVQAFVDILRWRYTHLECIKLWTYIRVCCHSNEIHAPIANPHNIAQLYLNLGSRSNVGMQRETERHTDACDQYTFRVVYDSCEM